jgi:hypothetical protein
MVALDQTKLLMTGVILGFVLAVLLFRPEIFPQDVRLRAVDATEVPSGQHGGEKPSLSYQELIEWQDELQKRETAQDEHKRELEAHSRRLDEREAKLEEGQRESDQRDKRLGERKAKLEQREAELDSREAELNEREAELDEREGALGQLEGRLRDEEERAEARAVALRNRAAHLSEREQELRQLSRLSAAAAVLTGSLAVPSIVVLVGLARRAYERKTFLESLTRRSSRGTLPPDDGQMTNAASVPNKRRNGHGKARGNVSQPSSQ